MDSLFPSAEVMDFYNTWSGVAIFSGVCFGFVPMAFGFVIRQFKVLIGGV